MKKINLAIFLLLLMLFSILPLRTFAQQPVDMNSFTPPSPTAYELGKYGQIPVGLFTGTPNANIPLYEYKTSNLSVPISLSYNSNGIKVDELGANVGLGWGLNVGGVISRIVRDLPDETRNNFYPEQDIHQNGVTSAMALTYFQQAGNNPGIDSETDLFMFNMGGYSGKFVFDNDHKIVLLPKQDLKIEMFGDAITNGFSITTANGIVYQFTEKELSRNRSEGSGHDFGDFFITAWYLSSIKHPKGDVITFTYNNEGYNYITSQRQALLSTPLQTNGCDGTLTGGGYNIPSLVSYRLNINGKKISQISSNVPEEGKVQFTVDYAHPDATGYNLLRNIQVLDKNNGLLENFDFNYLSTANKRVFLQEVITLDPTKKYQMEYNNPSLLPLRLSFSQDHWGYYNGKNNAYLFPKANTLELSTPNELKFINLGADKSPDPTFAQYGLLTKLIYPTKGYNEFIYEGNTYRGTKEVFPPTQQTVVNVNTISGQYGTTTDIKTLTNIKFDQEVLLNLGVSFNSNACSPNENVNISATVTLTDLTVTSNTQTIFQNTGNAITSLNNSFIFSPGMNLSYIYADLKANHDYQLKISVIRPCISAGAQVTYYLGVKTLVAANIALGGLRIKQVTANDLTSNRYMNYFYGKKETQDISTGQKGATPTYFETTTNRVQCSIPGQTADILTYQLSSSSLNNLYNAIDSRSTNYQFVTVSNGGANFENGGEEHEFILDQDYPSNPIYGNAMPSAPWTNFGMANGNEKAVKIFKKNSSGTGFIVVKTKTNTYTEDTRYHEEVYGYAIQKRFELYGTTDIVHTCTQADVNASSVNYFCDATHLVNYYLLDGTKKSIDIGHDYAAFFGINYWICRRGDAHNTSTTYYHPCYYKGVGGTLISLNQIENLNITEFKYISYWHYLSSSTEITYDANGANGISATSNYFYDNAVHMQLTRTETVNSDGTTFITRSKYPDDYTDGTGDVYATAIKDMKTPAVHFINAVIEKTSSIKKPGTTTELVTGSELIKYKQFGAGQYLPAQYFLLESLQSISNFAPATVNINGLFTIDSRYKQQSSVLSYNAKGRPLTVQRVQDVPVSYIWDITQRLPLTEATNAVAADIAFNSFEGYEDTGWMNTTNINTTPHSGAKGITIAAGNPSFGPTLDIVPSSQSKKFKVSAWIKTGTSFGASAGKLVIHTYNPSAGNNSVHYPTNVSSAIITYSFSNTANKWQYIEAEIDLGAIRAQSGIGFQTLGIRFFIYNTDAANTILVDDIRFAPSDASMKTFIWDSKNRLYTTSDEGDHYQRYEYDAMGRLNLIRDQNEYILQKNDYHYADATATNYVKTTIPFLALTTATQLQSLPATSKIENFTYLDGLGNTTQNVTKAISGNLSRDVVIPFVYDAFGREAKSYLPFVPNQATGAFVSNALTGQASYYAAGGYRIPVTGYPYSEKVFDGSPLNLIMEEAAPGDDWKLVNHHTNRYVYGSNLVGSANEPTIRLFALNSSNEAVSTANYAANSLSRKVTTDANNTTTIDYTDKLGRKVAGVVQDVANNWLCTYYVYDDFGNAAVVIPPKAFKKMKTSGVYNTASLTEDLVFYYKYDSRKRIVEKKVPGSGWEYMVYNPIDQPVLTQTAKQRVTNEWSFVKYDALGRLVVSGVWSNPSYTTRSAVETYVNSGSTWYESESALNYSTQFGYTNSSFPTTNATIQQANYYDHYDFDRNGTADATFNTTGIPSNALNDCMTGPGISFPIINIQGKLNKGKLTGTKTKVLDAANPVQWLYNYPFYDEYGRTIQTQSNDVLGATDLNNSVYNFRNQVSTTNQIHTQTNGTSIPVLNNYQYNKAGNLMTEMQQSGTDVMAQLSSKVYNDLGQLAENNLHRTNYCNSFLQSVDYSYNIRGWLTGINNLAFSNQGNGAGATNNDVNDLWGMELVYTTPTASLGGVAAYNGNITEKRWKSATDNVSRYYTYSYDKLNRLTNGKYSELVTAPATFGNIDRYKEGNITYDENGNILSLLRSGYRTNATFGTMDQLTYTYKGNQLATVVEAATTQGYNDFKDGNTVGDDYIYDASGNMIQDKNKGIASIAYNRFNLPTLITYTTGNRSIEYTYNAAGQKLRKKVNNNGSITNIWYCGKFIYNDAGLESFFTSEGRAIYNATATPKYRYEYHFKDQTGNVAMAFSDLNNDGVINTSEVIQQNVYYPFGLDMYGLNNTQIGVVNKFKFNGKELQDDFGLNLYDYGARQFDPQLGRFNQVDPHADRYPAWSPYNAMSCNPVLNTDPDGQDPTNYVDEKGETIKNTNDGNNQTVTVKNEDRSKFDIYAKVGEQKGVLNNKDYNNWMTGQLKGNTPSTTDMSLAAVGTAATVAEGMSKNILNSRSGFTSGKISMSSPMNYSKATATNVNVGAKVLGIGLTAWSIYDNEKQYNSGQISIQRRDLNRLNNAAGLAFPLMAIPMAVGDYTGQKYEPQITNSVTKPGGFLFQATKTLLNLSGTPTGE